MNLPIVNAHGEIVGYTNESPKLVGTSVRHSYAERLLGDAVKAAYIEITDPAELARVGAPPAWSGEWRCLALCSAEMTVENDIGMMRTTKLHARYSEGRAGVMRIDKPTAPLPPPLIRSHQRSTGACKS